MKRYLFLTFLVLSLLFTACQKNTTDTAESTTTKESLTITEAEDNTLVTENEETKETEGESTSAVVTETESIDNGIYEVEGIVVDAAMHSILIETAGGELLDLKMEDYEISTKDGLAIDDKVKITYQNHQVIKIVEIQ